MTTTLTKVEHGTPCVHLNDHVLGCARKIHDEHVIKRPNGVRLMGEAGDWAIERADGALLFASHDMFHRNWATFEQMPTAENLPTLLQNAQRTFASQEIKHLLIAAIALLKSTNATAPTFDPPTPTAADLVEHLGLKDALHAVVDAAHES